MTNIEELYYEICLIRAFEEYLLHAFSLGHIPGTTHTCIGQEANSVAILNNIYQGDSVWSNHRCHGHFISYSKKPLLLLKEILGKKEGICGGRGGSQHLCYKNFFSSGIQGSGLGISIGYAEANKMKGNIAISFIGDGTFGQGIVYESINIALIRKVPIFIVIEDNEIAQTTKYSDVHFSSINSKLKGLGVDGISIVSTDLKEIEEVSSRLIKKVRASNQPFFLHIKTIRLGPHSKSDDTRSKDEIQSIQNLDPIIINSKYVNNPSKIKLSAEKLIKETFENEIGEIF